MSRRLLFIPLLLIIVFASSLFIGWYSLPNWLPQLLNNQLAKYNVQTSHWRFERPSFSEWKIHQINISQNKKTITELSDITIQFSPTDLLQRKIKHIHVKQLKWVSIISDTQKNAPEAPLMSIRSMLPPLFRIKAQIPEASVAIDNILISKHITSMTGKETINVWTSVNQASLTMESAKNTSNIALNVSTEKFSASLKAQLNTELTTSIQLQNLVDNSVANVDFFIESTEENINISGKHSVDLALIKSLFKAYPFYTLSPSNKKLTEIMLKEEFSGEWTGNWSASFNKYLQASNLNLSSEQQLNINVSGNNGTANVEQAIQLQLINQELSLRFSPANYSLLVSDSAINIISQKIQAPSDLSIPSQWKFIIKKPIELNSTLNNLKQWNAKPIDFSINGKGTNATLAVMGELNMGIKETIALNQLDQTVGNIKLSEWMITWQKFIAKGVSHYDLKTKHGTSSLQIELPDAHQWLAPYNDHIPKNLSFNSGKIAANGSLNWHLSNDLTFNTLLVVDASDWSGLWNEQVFTGASLKSEVALSEKMDAKGKNGIAVINSFNPGLPINSIQSHFTWSLPNGDPELLKINVESFSANLLSGSVSSLSPFTLTPLNIETNIDLQLKNMSLADILALEQQPITGEGRLDGVIPIQISGKNIAVNNGEIHASKTGGWIKLDNAASFRQMAANNQGLNLLVEALNNFHYQTLKSKVDYHSNGDLLLAASLSGRNPDFKDGQRFNFNINIEENLKALFKSLQLSHDINERIGNKYK